MITILESGRNRMNLSGSPEPVLIDRTDNTRLFGQPGTAGTFRTIVDIHGFSEIHWPNREGEKFSPHEAHRVLAELKSDTVSLCWPATASVQGFGVSDGETFHVFSAEPDPDGHVRFISLESPEPGLLRMTLTGTRVKWSLRTIPVVEQPGHSGTQEQNSPENTLWQLGLIDPDGNTAIPRVRGFAVLEDAADRIVSETGTPKKGDIIHVFGFAAGHDRGYPDYSPSAELGGIKALRKAIAAVKSRGFAVSLYMNARLAEMSAIDGDSCLQEAILTDSKGNRIVETYRGRDFAVMNPESPAWRDRLLEEALKLAKTGAEWIQLDQVAGRAAPVTPGAPWGAGYRAIIREIQSFGLKVWIQGVSDYYPADAFEATWRQVEILNDGTLRGGCPFGTPDTTLIEVLGFSSNLIVPALKSVHLSTSGLGIIRDGNAHSDELPLWNSDWPGTINSANNSRIAGENNGGSK